MPNTPIILERNTVARSRLFRAEELQLEFSNGEQRTYEKLCSGGPGAVLMVPMLDDSTVLMVREYAGGLENYHLSLPKGAMDAGETPAQAANRELKEEIGYGAKSIHFLKQVHLSPSYMEHKINILIMRDLYPETLQGDEPEPIEVVPSPFDDLFSLVMQDDVIEGRSIAALYMTRDWLAQKTS
ncbi:ADP compounds hydrolase NudE [Gilvimarinus sp. SDUM040013]|uniref:ADP compounds hydrolase NudE n=1 Tax=Gilvimarinus gilvus TaxID=3058038 RepID=A0ABU4RY09_9GAMM|nr:ADP compounds hydrolase NudE [Gilvimarinus sp. SDUM040013]MDO3388649.1 ADP compounds hydrolase NudE [Gilvimarinus sp. SDUM040013]MDX6849544.1 ADP compounds hydrolase NudE [Gilvimarinus sp. SDUM040013]